MNGYSATIDACIPPGHDRFSDTTSPYPAHLLEQTVISTAVAIPVTRSFRITGRHVAAHPRGAILTVECTDRDRAAEHTLRALLDPARHEGEALWRPFAAWNFTLTEIRPHPANT
ncbi:hypothetical protein HDA32_005130 [Spinactinospora alkalitolerans]|uniref:Uncharacterized protein n=1 Tax=Spinactinospora alkalitolerans TaxID=687207 RepID=A0A852U7V5_9ACTN|nr:hypothetical protein [Spinactinospora alkalitolerans]NYE50010.1 hypothetical protein [Spinactinospora alkalitolerans]